MIYQVEGVKAELGSYSRVQREPYMTLIETLFTATDEDSGQEVIVDGYQVYIYPTEEDYDNAVYEEYSFITPLQTKELLDFIQEYDVPEKELKRLGIIKEER